MDRSTLLKFWPIHKDSNKENFKYNQINAMTTSYNESEKQQNPLLDDTFKKIFPSTVISDKLLNILKNVSQLDHSEVFLSVPKTPSDSDDSHQSDPSLSGPKTPSDSDDSHQSDPSLSGPKTPSGSDDSHQSDPSISGPKTPSDSDDSHQSDPSLSGPKTPSDSDDSHQSDPSISVPKTPSDSDDSHQSDPSLSGPKTPSDSDDSHQSDPSLSGPKTPSDSDDSHQPINRLAFANAFNVASLGSTNPFVDSEVTQNAWMYMGLISLWTVMGLVFGIVPLLIVPPRTQDVGDNRSTSPRYPSHPMEAFDQIPGYYNSHHSNFDGHQLNFDHPANGNGGLKPKRNNKRRPNYSYMMG